MTIKKEVLAVVHGRAGLIGYTTLTYKPGHALKTGPTVLRPRFRGRGLGLETRRAIERYAIQNGRLKLYCTCPDDNEKLVKHFISAGYRIEGHLKAHYQAQRGEILFGKMLEHSIALPILRKYRSVKTGTLSACSEFRTTSLKRAISMLFVATWFDPGDDFVGQIIRLAARRNPKTYEEKPLSLYCLKSRNECAAVLLLIEKRGGAVKALLLLATAHEPSIAKMIESAENSLTQEGKRKIYFLHPLNDPMIYLLLLGRGYRCEGVLEEPYAAGQDVLVLSKFL